MDRTLTRDGHPLAAGQRRESHWLQLKVGRHTRRRVQDAPPVEERVFGGAPFLSPPPHSRAPPAGRVFARRHLVFAQQRRFGTAAAVDVLDRDADAAKAAVDAARRAAATEELLQAYSL